MFSRPWKLLLLAASMALALIALAPGGLTSPGSALAAYNCNDTHELTINIVDEDDDPVTVAGVRVRVSPDPQDASGTRTYIDNSTNDDDNETGLILEEDACESSGGDGYSFEVTQIPDDLDCEPGEIVEIDNLNNDEGVNVELDCGGAEGNVVVILDAEGGTASDDFDYDIDDSDGDCNDVSQSLNDGDEWGVDCEDAGNEYVITQDAPTGWTLVAIDCSDVGIPNADIEVDVDDGTVTFTLGANDSIECTFVNEKGSGGGGNVSSVTVSAGPNSVNCSGSSFITIVVKNAQGGNVADGTSVSVSTNLGSVNPTSATTQGGGVLILYTGPSNQGGNATVTAKAGDITATTQVAVNCNQAPAPTNPPPPPAGSTGGGIQPPNTGDAGLADNGSSFGYAGLAFIASVLLGTIAFARVRA